MPAQCCSASTQATRLCRENIGDRPDGQADVLLVAGLVHPYDNRLPFGPSGRQAHRLCSCKCVRHIWRHRYSLLYQLSYVLSDGGIRTHDPRAELPLFGTVPDTTG